MKYNYYLVADCGYNGSIPFYGNAELRYSADDILDEDSDLEYNEVKADAEFKLDNKRFDEKTKIYKLFKKDKIDEINWWYIKLDTNIEFADIKDPVVYEIQCQYLLKDLKKKYPFLKLKYKKDEQS